MRIAVLCLLLLLGGCATVEPVDTRPAITQEVNERNYEIGRPQTAVVGDTLIRVRRYFVQKREVSAVEANTDFAVFGGGYDIHFVKDQTVPIRGTTLVDGVRYYVLPVETTQLGLPAVLELLIAEDGHIHSKALNGGVIYSYRAEPSDGRLLPVQRVDVVKTQPFVNYEIVFNGSDGQAMRFTYREYSPDDLARTAFFQDLSYPINAKVIRFRNLSLDVLNLDEQAITFVVRSD